MIDIPVKFRREGDVMRPLDRFFGYFNEKFKDGEVYAMTVEVDDPPSDASKRHFFAVMNDAFHNLPDDKAFADLDHFRRWVAIKTGHCNVQDYAYDTIADAKRFADHLRKEDVYAIILLRGKIVRKYTAKSVRRMKRAEFESMKHDVLSYVANEMLGVSIDELTQNAGKAA